MEQFRLRYGIAYAFRSLLHPCILYGINHTIELTGHIDEFVSLQISSTNVEGRGHSRSDWEEKHYEMGEKILGAGLIVGESHFVDSPNRTIGADDEASIVLEGLLTTGKYKLYYLIEGDAKYACGNFSEGYFFEAPEVEEGLVVLNDTTDPGDIAIVTIFTHAGTDVLEFENSTKLWNITLEGKLQTINENGDVPIFCWLSGCQTWGLSYIVNDSIITNSIMWFSKNITGGDPIEAAAAFATNLNYAFYSVEELWNSSCTYPTPPKWWEDYNDNPTHEFWSSKTIKSVTELRNYGVGQSDNYPSEFFLNPHTEQFEDGCWLMGYNLTDGSQGRDYNASLSNYPYKRDIEVWEEATTYNTYLRYVGVRYTFTKNWDTNLNVLFNVRATSTCGGQSPITNFYARIYDENGDYVYDSKRTVYKTTDQDTGWNNKTLVWDNSLFFPGHRYQLVFYYSDGWLAYKQQKIWINESLIISENIYTAVPSNFDEFESLGYFNYSWPQVEQTCQGTAYFVKSGTYKRFGSFSAKHYSSPQTGDGYSTERWNVPGIHTGGTLEGWVYRDHFSDWAFTDIHILFNDSNNHYYLRFYKETIYLRQKINGVTQTLGSTSLGTGWHRKWWWFRVTLTDSKMSDGNDTLIAHVKQAGALSMTTVGPYEAKGDLSTGYVALRSRLGQFGPCYYDDVKFVGFNLLSNGGFEGAANLAPWETLLAERSLTKYSGSYGCKLHEYSQIWQKYQDGSIWQNVCIPVSMIANFSFYMKSSSSDATVNVTITVDGETTQMWSFNKSSDWVQRVIDGNDLIQGKWITEIKIEQYGCPSDSGAFIDEVAFFYD
ncbi:MAG: hypothetical protein ACFFCQ_10490 [Promethearchaeota archaeon]